MGSGRVVAHSEVTLRSMQPLDGKSANRGSETARVFIARDTAQVEPFATRVIRPGSGVCHGSIVWMPISIPPATFASWGDLQTQLAQYDHRWAFRGMGSATWPLQTSLERLLVSPVVEAERYLLTAFQRRAHHHVRDCPDPEDYLE
jgi:hypothetical protein